MQWDQSKMQHRQNLGPDSMVWEPMRDDTDERDPRDYLAGLWRKKLVAALIMALFIGLGIVYIMTCKPIYESTAEIVVVNSNNSAPNAPENDIPLLSDLQALTRSRSTNTQTAIISSPDVIDEAYGGLSSDTARSGFAASQAPAWSYRIEGLKETDVIRISTWAYTPTAAANFANAIAGTYFIRDLRSNTAATRKVRQTAEAKMKDAETDLSKANAALTDFKQRTGFISPDAQLSKAIDRYSELAMSLDQTRAQAQADEQSVASTRSQLASQGKTVETSRSIMRNPRLTSILARIDSLNTERAAILREFTPESPEAAIINDSIRQEEAQLIKMTATVVDSQILSRNPIRDSLLTKYATDVAGLAASSARERAIGASVSEMQQSLQQLPQQERQYLDLAQRATVAKSTFDLLAGKYRTLLLTEQTIMPKGILTTKARMASSPKFPHKKSVMMLFVVLGAMAGIAAAIGADRLDKRAYDRHTIERILGIDTLAMIPEVTRSSSRLLGIDGQNSSLLESFRILRNSIMLSGAEIPPKIIAITSAGAGEGKSSVSINLAAAMAMDGKRTLLVDADTRKPSLHKMLSTSNEIGLTNVLRGELSLDEAALSTRIDKVAFLPSGEIVIDSPELLNSTNGREVFNLMRMKYDIIILDCPPCAGLGDMQIISSIADAMLMVISMKCAVKPRLKATANFLEQAYAPLLGLVINRAHSSIMEESHISSYCQYAEKIVANESRNDRAKVNAL